MGKDLDILQAVKDNDLASLTKLLQKASKQGKNKLIGNSKRLNINFQDGDGMCALHQAALMSGDQMLQTLLDNGALPGLRDNKGMVALHYAAWQGHSASVQLLLQRGSPVNEQALEGETPLHLACQHGHFDVVTLLLNQHADPTICNKNLRSSLDLACEHGRTRVVELLLRSNLCQKLLEDSPTDTLDNSRTTCLHLAARNGHVDIIQTLLQAGMNINRSTLKGTALHEATTTGKTEAVKLLLDWSIDVNRPNSYDQTALDIVTKSAGATGSGAKELRRLLKEASCAVYARALRDYSNVYDPGSLSFKEGDIITVLEQRTDGIWRGYVVQEGRMAKTGMFPANHVALIDSKVTRQGPSPGQMYSQVPDLLTRGPHYTNSNSNSSGGGSGSVNSLQFPTSTGLVAPHSGSDRGSLGSSGTDDSSGYSSHSHSQQPQQPGNLQYPLPPSSLGSAPGSGFMPPRSALSRDPSGADSGFSSSQSLPQYTPSSPAGPSQFGKSPFVFGPTTGSTVTSNGPNTPNGILSGSSGDANGGCISAYPGHPAAYQHGPSGPEQWLPQHLQHQQIHMHPGTGLVVGCESGNMRGGASPARDSPGHSNRNSAASSDSGRGYSTGGGHGGLDSKLSHNYVNVHVSSNNVSGHPHHLHQQKHVSNNGGGLHASIQQQQQQQQQQHRLSGQSYESGVSSRQSYHSSGSSSVGSLDLLEEQGYSTSATINVGQLVQAGVADTEVLHAWLHDLDFGEYYPLFLQAGYDMPTISRMTPEDLTAIGITKPAHRKRLKSEIARLNIHDGIPDFRPSDLMEWLHLLGLGAYLDTLCGQGYDSLDYVTDITWEDLEEIGIKKLGHQKKIMLAIDRLKRLKTSGKRMSSTDGRTASLELLEPPPPAPPISGRWSGGEGILPPNMYDASGCIIGGVRPKKSPSGDSISTTSSGNSGSGSSGAGSGSHHYPHGGEMRVIPLPREDAGGAGLAGAMPYRHNSTGSASGLQPDVVAIQVKRNLRSSTSEDKRGPVTSHGGFFPPQQQQYNHPQQLMYHSFQGPVRRTSESDVFADHHSQIRSFEAEDRRRPSAQAEFDSEKHEAELRTEGKKSFFPSLKPGLGDSNNQASLSVEAGEHIYDTPQISPSQNSGKPAVMPKPTVSFASSSGHAGSLHVSTTADVSQPQSKSSPSGKSGKKVPPPPPVRTDSIRQENAPPGSPNRCLSTGQPLAPSVSVSATIHPPSSSSSSTTSTPMPAPVPPKVAAKPAPPPVMQKPQLHQASVAAKMQQQTSSAQHQHHNAHINSSVSQGQYPSQPIQPGPITPGMQQQFRPEPSILIKPKSCSGPPPTHGHQQSLIKSPLPSKAPIGSSSASTSNSYNQSMLSSSYQQTKNQGMSQTVSSTSSVVSNAKGSDPQAQALSNCMKSLSEKLGVKNLQREEKEKDDEDQFPDNVSTDSDDFPPPPPPIAMDIITPKIHNYGIPSSRKQGEYGLHHRHDFSHKPQPSLMGSPRLIVGPGGSVVGSPRVGGGMNTTVSYAEVHHRADAATSRTAPLKASGVGPGFRGPHSGHVIGQQALLNRQPQAQPSVLGSVSAAAIPSGSSHPSQMPPAVPIKTSTHSQVKESTPEPAHPMSNENRSDSTSSFESSSSSSSLDSNTLPFANENVGTIKQRAAAATTGADTANATVPAPENSSVYSLESARSKDFSISQDNESHRTVPGGISSSSSSKPSSVHPLPSCSSGHQSFPHQQRQQLTSSQPSGGIRPPVPTKKPTLSPKPVRPKEESTSAAAASDQGHVAQKQLRAQEERPAQELNSNNVLSDIDDMLQGLTDELDAALEEELGS